MIGERRLEALVNAMGDAVTVLDADGGIVLANPAALALLDVESLDALVAIGMPGLWERFALYTDDGRPVGDNLRTLPGESTVLRRIDRRDHFPPPERETAHAAVDALAVTLDVGLAA